MEIRREHPGRSYELALNRQRRDSLSADGKLNILAADHPARRVTKVGDNPLGMANRRDYVARVARVLTGSSVDGVMATMDVLEDLLLLDDLTQAERGASLLDGKLLLVSLNRGGLAGTAWEMNDPVTAARPEICDEWNFDGAKLLLRICDEEPSSLTTMMACSQVITGMNALGLPTFLEPLPVVKTESGYQVVKNAEALAKCVGVASALGDSSRRLWLKLPYCENYDAVAGATSLPILLLGGEASGSPAGFLGQLAAGLAAGENVRGALVGRNVLYPGTGDPLRVAESAGGIIHRGWTAEQALEALSGPGASAR
jgi:DhnA family fructose-bisphosphate aldolase class Ia